MVEEHIILKKGIPSKLTTKATSCPNLINFIKILSNKTRIDTNNEIIPRFYNLINKYNILNFEHKYIKKQITTVIKK